ncbi:hypothetical protein DFO45_4555 [Azorhizobium sp. AG788]|uniref:hypothetical protein n=1 Tax=Azorhizobium sp. AG788 TaxID=2183897 RepID=UPI00105C65F9|nr:hypothetical protein [Azorhizobium sp. AG788]TDT88803.1 hypothetical protein DFO45_4555 [Azorhizobium sp. AG788]
MDTAGNSPADVAAMVRARQGIEIRPEEAAAYAALVAQLNATVAAGAKARVDIDGCPWSYANLLAAVAERGEGEA